MEENPLISVIIPCYNRAHLIGETLQSVIDQTYPNWECIIIDDNSTDSSISIIQEFIKKDQRFKLHERPGNRPKGANTCRNYGLEKAQGSYIIALDSDDLLAPFCLWERACAIQTYPNYDFWVFSTEVFQNTIGDKRVLVNIITDEDSLGRFLKMDVIWLSTGPIWRKTVLEKIGKWDENLKSWQDWDLSTRAIIAGLRFKFYGIIDNYWRLPISGSIGSDSTSREHLISHEYLIQKIKLRIKEAGKMTPKNKLYLLSIYFWIGKKWAEEKKIKKTLTAWTKTTDLQGIFSFFINFFLLISFYHPFSGKISSKILGKVNHFSKFIFNNHTFRKLKITSENSPYLHN